MPPCLAIEIVRLHAHAASPLANCQNVHFLCYFCFCISDSARLRRLQLLPNNAISGSRAQPAAAASPPVTLAINALATYGIDLDELSDNEVNGVQNRPFRCFSP